ncbi:uncharacterized protein LOC124440699 [Xenia sp. Carnegie-2017]|uniref:uncharacterized protein LOC124440699 n=1 Tax=Xenia sp. Carnegie-2017 TaxID=2897299 RepID=UPI001F041F5A|nr:uncharacterized protein LOC124440699 [Xenia sp. Carnegie-2017]
METTVEVIPNYTTYPKDPQKNDVMVYEEAAAKSLDGQRYNVTCHHKKSFDTESHLQYETKENNKLHHRKTQHFVRGKMAGGSSTNTLLYGNDTLTKGFTLPQSQDKIDDNSFLYGSNAVKRYQNTNPAKRLNHNFPQGEMTDGQKNRYRKLAKEEDNYLNNYYQQKIQQQSLIAEEKRKDLDMLKNYNPWGRPGGGAPRGYNNNQVNANVTKNVQKLKQDNRVTTGAGGGGSPNRTFSGNVVTSLRIDPEIRFQAAQHNSNIDPRLRYKPDYSYGLDLSAQVNEVTNRKILEKQKEKEEDIKLIEKTLFPSHKSILADEKDVRYESISSTTDQLYDPWGKGVGGLPERNQFGKILKNRRHLTNISESVPIKENINPKKKITLVKNPFGQSCVRESSPNDSYNPFGRPGAGAPLKDELGNLIVYTSGKLANADMGSAQLRKDRARKKDYLSALEKQQEEIKNLRSTQRSNMLNSANPGVVSWLCQGKVGQPEYDSLTNKMKSNAKATSDVTREKLQIRRYINQNSKRYCEDLQEMANERNRRRQNERAQQRELSFHHIKTMNDVWGRPGGGAPVTKAKDQIISPRKHSEQLLPTTRSNFR